MAAAVAQPPAPARPLAGIRRPRPGELPCVAASARAARHMVRRKMLAWGLEPLTGDAELLVSELVANAVRHTGNRTIVVGVDRHAATVRITVEDYCRTLPFLMLSSCLRSPVLSTLGA